MRIAFDLQSSSTLPACTLLKTRAHSERKYWGRPQRQKTSSRSQKGRETRNNSQMPQEKYFLQLSADTRPHWPRLACDLQQTLQEVTTLPFPSELPPRKPRVQPPRLNLLCLPLTAEPVFRHHPRAVGRDRRRSSHCSRYLSNHTATIYKLMKRSIKSSLKYHFILY